MAGTLRAAAVESPEAETRWILASVTGSTPAALSTGGDMDEAAAARALELARRRAAGEPLQYVTGATGFRSIEVHVGPGVFIPRPETETVVEHVLARLPHGGIAVDVGTGSGAIALSIKAERPDAVVWATESSPAALAWAERNRDRLGLDVELAPGDLFSALPPFLDGRIDVVVANPPYIAPEEAPDLPADVVDHEPHEALFAPRHGLAVVTRLVEETPRLLAPQGWLVVEIAASQGEAILALLARVGYRGASVERDLAGRPRVALGQRP